MEPDEIDLFLLHDKVLCDNRLGRFTSACECLGSSDALLFDNRLGRLNSDSRLDRDDLVFNFGFCVH